LSGSGAINSKLVTLQLPIKVIAPSERRDESGLTSSVESRIKKPVGPQLIRNVDDRWFVNGLVRRRYRTGANVEGEDAIAVQLPSDFVIELTTCGGDTETTFPWLGMSEGRRSGSNSFQMRTRSSQVRWENSLKGEGSVEICILMSTSVPSLLVVGD
jgi:hypothetical protein